MKSQMNRQCSTLVITILFSIMLPGYVLAAEGPHPPRVKEHFGSWDVMAAMQMATSELKSGYYVEADFMYNPNRFFAFGGGLGFSIVDNEVRNLSKGDVMMVPLLFKTRFSTPGKVVSAYLDMGTGFFFFDHSIDPSITSVLSLFGISYTEEMASTFGFCIGTGVRFQTSDRTTIGLGIRKIVAKPEVTYTVAGGGASITVAQKVDLGSNIVGLTFQSRF